MITEEQLDEYLGEDKDPFKVKDIDHDMRALSLLRERIPYDECKSIIGGAGHDVIYLCNTDTACEFLSIEDLEVLADCNVGISEENGRLFLFV